MERPRAQQSHSINDTPPQSGKQAVQHAGHEEPETGVVVKSESGVVVKSELPEGAY